MYLSRLNLPLTDPSVQRFLSDLDHLHHKVMTAFPSRAGRVLFRIEPSGKRSAHPAQAVVLIQSEAEPCWQCGALPGSATAECKRFDPNFRSGQRLRFRLRTNPTVKKKREGKKNGARLGVLGEERQLAWLEKKAEAGGFKVNGCVTVDEGMVTGKKPTDNHRLSFRAVRYEGMLTVTDPARFAYTLRSGIGSGKAFGFGLLSLAPVG